MSNITPALLSAPGREHALRLHDTISRSRLLQAQAETHTSADFTFVTAEGDKVTLSADALQQASYTRYDARGALHGQGFRARAEELTLTSTQNSALRIEGDLNAAELQDIQEVVRQVSALAQEVFAGGKTEDLDQALDLDDLSTLKSFEATVEYSQSLSLSRITQGPSHGRHAVPEGQSAPADILAAAPPASTRTAQLLDALQAAETTTPAAEQAERPEASQESDLPTGAFGTHQQLFEAVKQAIEINQQTGDTAPPSGEVTSPSEEKHQEPATTAQHRKSGVFRVLADILSARAAREDAPPQQALSRLAAQFLQRLQGLGQPAAPQDSPPQSAAASAPSPLAA